MSEIILNEQQEAALDKFLAYLTSPDVAFILEGYAGCGKSTLVNQLLDRIPEFLKTLKLINPDQQTYEIFLTATTNKAAENLQHITGYGCRTIHSLLGLRVHTDYKTGRTSLRPARTSGVLSDSIIFIDEASYIDSQLLEMIFMLTHNCKIVFIGDPAQLTPVMTDEAPVFKAGFEKASLTDVVRQAKGSPIIELATKFRETVSSGQFFNFKPDGSAIIHLDREDFHKALIDEFTKPDWHYHDSKILAWTNKKVIYYNNFVRDHVMGDPQLQVNDYAICNSYVTINRKSIKTDELVLITRIEPDCYEYEVFGRYVTVDHSIRTFQPYSIADMNKRIARARKENMHQLALTIEQSWIDLRAAYSCTVNKSQGSTYNKVFIDLSDICRCNSGKQIARMLYVAVSRARNQVILTGDIC